MDKPLVEQPLGSVGKVEVKVAGGVLSVELDAGAVGLSAGVVLKLDSDQVCDALAKAIPGTIDDALLGVLKVALKAV